MLIKSLARAEARALSGAVLVGAGLGILLGGAYIAGGAARTAAAHARVERLASAAKAGFSEAALRAEAAGMAPGALAIARQHDPFTAAGAPERDRENTMLAARLVADAPVQPAPGARMPLLRTSLNTPAVPARNGGLRLDNALSGARALDCLSSAVYYEARGESREGQEAVAQVVMNRVRRPGFPKTVCGVVYQGAQVQSCQFSFACDGSTRGPKEMTAWRRAQAIAARALGGFVLAQVGDATHFHVSALGSVWGEGLVRVAQIGAHSFYRLTGRQDPGAHATPALYAHASELVDKPVYAEAKAGPPPAPEGSSLILAAAVAPAPGAAQKPEPAPAAASAPAEKPAATAIASTSKGAS